MELLFILAAVSRDGCVLRAAVAENGWNGNDFDPEEVWIDGTICN